MIHFDPVVLSETLGNPQAPSRSGPGPIPWPEFDGTQPLHVPGMEELVRNSRQGIVIGVPVSQNAGLNDLRRRQMLHSIAGPVVVGEMDHESVVVEFRSSPHAHFSSDNLLDIPNEGRPTAPFIPARMNDDVICL